jgi:hypothetical protein
VLVKVDELDLVSELLLGIVKSPLHVIHEKDARGT